MPRRDTRMIDESNFDRLKAIADQTARRYLPRGAAHEADDVASETLFRLFDSPPVEDQAAWIRVTARRLASEVSRRFQRTTYTDGVDDAHRDEMDEALEAGANRLASSDDSKTEEEEQGEGAAALGQYRPSAQSEVTRHHAELERYGRRARVFLREVSGKESVVARYMEDCAKAREFVKHTRPASARGAKYRALVDWLAWDMGDNLTVTEGPTRVDVRELAPPHREPQEGESSILYRGCTNETEARAYRERAEAKAGHRLRPKPDYDNIRPLPKWANPPPTSEAKFAQRCKIGSAVILRRLAERFRDYARTP